MLYFPHFGKHLDLLRQRGFAELLHKRLVFTITTGRSGTQTLAEVFGCADNTTSVHEPPPEFGKCLRRVQRNAEAAFEFLLEEKLPAMLAAPEACYVETSHLLCKGFIEPMLELGLRPHFVLIERDCRAVAKSFTQLNSIPERTQLGRDYMLSPADPCLLETLCWEEFSDYQLCYWYTLEMRQRIRWYAALFDRLGIGHTSFDFADLREAWKVIELARSCGLHLSADEEARIASIVAHPINAKEDDKVNAGRQAEVADPAVLAHAESIVARACKTSLIDAYLPRMTTPLSKSA